MSKEELFLQAEIDELEADKRLLEEKLLELDQDLERLVKARYHYKSALEAIWWLPVDTPVEKVQRMVGSALADPPRS